MNRRVVCLVLVLGAVSIAFLTAPPARGLQWTQTSQADFLAGRSSGVSVTPPGELLLASTTSTWSREGVILDVGTNPPYDSVYARCPFILNDVGTYRMWYMGSDGTRFRLLYATSPDGVAWTGQGIAIDVLTPPLNLDSAVCASVIRIGAAYRMWFAGGFWAPPVSRIYTATSPDAATWTVSATPALAPGPAGTWDDYAVGYPAVVRDSQGRYHLYYTGDDGVSPGWNLRIGRATSTDGVTFTRAGSSPVLSPGPAGSWDDREAETPAVLEGAPWGMWYTGVHTAGRGEIGRATSDDGENWTKSPGNPALTVGPAAAWDGASVLTPFAIVDGPNVYLYYTGVDGATGTTERIGRARLVPAYAPSAWWESAVLDSGAPGTVWSTLAANASVPDQTALTLRTRSGDVPTPDGSWSAWSAALPPGTAPIASPRGRYLQVRADLSTTNAGRTPVLRDVAVDYALNTASRPRAVSPISHVWMNTTGARIEWNYSDPESDPQAGFRVQISDDEYFATVAADSGTVLSTDTSWRSPPLADGGWYWQVQTLDAFGVWSTWTVPEQFRIDTTGPIVTIRSGREDLPNATGIVALSVGDHLSLSAVDAGSGAAGIEISVDGAPWRGTYAFVDVPFDAPGRHVLAARATDIVGNVGPTRVVVVDAAYPINWTPLVAAALALVILIAGAFVVSRTKDPSAPPSNRLAWALMSGPGIVLEGVVGVYSLATGELSMPPWLGAGLFTVLAVAAVGLVSIAIGGRAFPAKGAPPPAEPEDEKES